jgi:hypothetical protein
VPFTIHATCQLGEIVSRRIKPQRAVKQARDYQKLGYAAIRIVDTETGAVYSASSLAELVQRQGQG